MTDSLSPFIAALAVVKHDIEVINMTPEQETDNYRQVCDSGLNALCESVGICIDYFDDDVADFAIYERGFNFFANALNEFNIKFETETGDFHLSKVNLNYDYDHLDGVVERLMIEGASESIEQQSYFPENGDFRNFKPHLWTIIGGQKCYNFGFACGAAAGLVDALVACMVEDNSVIAQTIVSTHSITISDISDHPDYHSANTYKTLVDWIKVKGIEMVVAA